MSLQQLPLELFQDILNIAVFSEEYCICEYRKSCKCGIIQKGPVVDPRNLRLRLVNHFFNHEILSEFGRFGFLISHLGGWKRSHLNSTLLITRYLTHRPYPKGSDPVTNFPALINVVVDSILVIERKECEFRFKPSAEVVSKSKRYIKTRRYYYIQTLLAHCIPQHRLFHKPPRPPIITSPISHHILAASVLLQITSTLNQLVSTVDLTKCSSEFWGTPLEAAITVASVPMVRILLAHGADANAALKISNECLRAEFVGEGKMEEVFRVMMGLGLESEDNNGDEDCEEEEQVPTTSQLKLLTRSSRPYQTLIKRCIDAGNPRLAVLLLESQTEYPRAIDDTRANGYASYLKLCLRQAGRKGDVESVRRLLQLYADPQVCHELFTLITRDRAEFMDEAGNETRSRQIKALKLLAQRRAEAGIVVQHRSRTIPDTEYGYDWCHELLNPAIQKGHVDVLRILLDLGAKPRLSHVLTRLQEAAQRPESLPAISYLFTSNTITLTALEADKQAQSWSNTNVATCMVKAAQANNLELVQFLLDQGVSPDDEEWYAANKCPPPIVAAKRFGAKEVTKLLRVLSERDTEEAERMWEWGEMGQSWYVKRVKGRKKRGATRRVLGDGGEDEEGI